MMRIHTLPLGDNQTNCYIVCAEGSSSCVVIDPACEGSHILSVLQDLHLTVDAILLTHGHFDHVGAVKKLAETTGCHVYMGQGDYSPQRHPMRNFLYPIADCREPEIHFCEEGEAITAGGLTFQTLETPGHTWGSVCYRCENVLFSGDTLFAGTIGRTDLPGGSWDVICQSLCRLKQIEENLTVYPGHGESTTLAWEKQYNPYMKGTL